MPDSRPSDRLLNQRIAALIRHRHELVGLAPRGPIRSETAEELTHGEFARLSAALLRLQRGLTGNRALIGARYMDDPDLLAAYLLFYWPVSYAQVSSALAQAAFQPRRALDLGSGPGPATAALLDSGADRAVLVDASGDALDLASRVLSIGGSGRGDLRFVSLDLEREDPYAALAGGEPFDCVVFGHSLNELWPEDPDRAERRRSLVLRSASVLSPGGALLVVEPALLSTSRDALELRDGLVAEGWSIRAPCPGRSRLVCPAFAAGPGHTCHDELRWDTPETVRQLARRTGLDKDSLKATWFLARPPRRDSDAAGAAAPPGAAESQADLSAYPEDAFRVVSDALLNKAGRVRFLLCGKSGRFPFSAPADDPRSRNSGFLYLRRGDVIRVAAPETRSSGWGLASDTRIEVLKG